MSRIYQFSFRNYCPEKCISCKGLGQKSLRNRTISDLEISLTKAKSGEYEYVLLPCNALFSAELDDYVNKIKVFGLKPLLQINAKSYSTSWESKFKTLGPIRLQFVIDRWSADDLNKLNLFFSEGNGDRDALVVVTKDLRLNNFLSEVKKDFLEKTRYYFPLKLSEAEKNYLDNDEIVSLMKAYEGVHKFRPLKGLDVFDPRIQDSANLEPDFSAIYLSKNENEAINLKYSVVIPSYNNAAYVTNTVRHLLSQTLGKNEFEVIVVDDGSQDNSKERLSQLVNSVSDQLDEKLNLKYIYFPRPRERQMGDGQFRAGIARNLGVKNANGEYICFLDSDIITPPNFLEVLFEQHQQYDAIQTKRIYLTESVSNEFTNYSDINENTDSFVPEGGYWQKFYDEPTPWNERKGNWKYACTYNFSLKKSLFKDLGWFRKNYHFYGFEDTDLGLRVVRSGGKLLLSDLHVYHLFHVNDKSEFKNSDFLRQMVLRKTAKIFFHNSLDLEIHEQLGGLLAEKTIAQSVKAMFRRIFKPTHMDQTIKQARAKTYKVEQMSNHENRS